MQQLILGIAFNRKTIKGSDCKVEVYICASNFSVHHFFPVYLKCYLGYIPQALGLMGVLTQPRCWPAVSF